MRVCEQADCAASNPVGVMPSTCSRASSPTSTRNAGGRPYCADSSRVYPCGINNLMQQGAAFFVLRCGNECGHVTQQGYRPLDIQHTVRGWLYGGKLGANSTGLPLVFRCAAGCTAPATRQARVHLRHQHAYSARCTCLACVCLYRCSSRADGQGFHLAQSACVHRTTRNRQSQ